MRWLFVGVALAASLCVPAPIATAARSGPEVVRIKDPAITESSGLVARDGTFFTINDSGGEGVVYVIDGDTGRTVRTIDFSASPRDVEALAPGVSSSELWVGDIGDNDAVRGRVSVTSVGRFEQPRRYRLSYPRGPVDAEALLVNPVTGRVYLASKEIFGGTLYAAPVELRRNRVNELTDIGDVGSVVTDGAFFPDGRHLILRGYLRATVYAFPSLKSVGSFALPREPQGEGIAVSPAGKVFVSSEGANEPILSVTLPSRVRVALANEPAPGGVKGTVTRARDKALDDTSWLPGGLWTAGGAVLVVVGVGGWVLVRRRRPGR
ncbi:hypothetical protein [Nocardioides sp.]|uniref:hypothetical protein n=1 Tax=Nocardioides sp. TaxID=35761 RepID=UPI003D0AD43D